ncbi:MAG: YitT family protein [Tissierellia bacterium]|nr:YitT family protein [Tissierellia bacterium]
MIKDIKWYKVLLSYIFLAIGVLIMAMSLEYFLGPNTIAPGGVTGFAVVIDKLTSIPIYITNLVINIPLFILGMKTLGKSAAIKTIYSTVLLSLFLRILPSTVLTHDIFLSAIFGGLLMGIGLGIVFKFGGTTGGTDLAGSILNNKFPALSTVTFMTIIDLLVVVFAGIVDKKIETSLYSIIAMFMVMKVVDTILEGMGYLKSFIIITNKPDEVSERLMIELERGVTSLKGKGMYTKEDKEVLLCVVNRAEFSRVKNIVKELDPKAFVMVSEIYEVLGEGFKEI